MKVLFCDPLNTQNAFYTYAKYLRQKGVDARVIISTTVPEVHTPRWHDGGGKQDWVIRMDLPYFLPLRHPLKYSKLQAELIALANEFDVIGCSGLAPLWMRYSKKPFILFSYGSDIDQMAVQGWSGDSRQKQWFGIKDKVVHSILRGALQMSMQRARATVIAPYQLSVTKMLELPNPVFLPHLIDTSLFKPLLVKSRDTAKSDLRTKLKCDLVLFHPSRQTWVDKDAKDCKGNDSVFNAFRELLSCTDLPKMKMLCVNKGWDLEKSKDMIKSLGIEKDVVWMDPVDKQEMCSLYNAADIVLDQFAVGVLALCALEPLACGTPSVSYIGNPPKEFFYPEMPPVCKARTEEDIYNTLRILAKDATLRNRLGTKGRNWVEKYCSPDVSMSKFVELFEKVISG